MFADALPARRASQGSNRGEQEGTAMKFCSYNIQYGVGKDGRVDLHRIAL